jgi:hypothetical protein
MNALERDLAALAAHLDVPAGARISAQVSERVRGLRSAHRTRRVRLALTALGAAIATAVAVPLAPAIADWLGVGGIAVQQVPEVPGPSPERELELGVPATALHVTAVLGFRAGSPSALGEPDSVWLNAETATPVVSFVYSATDELPATPGGAGALFQVFSAPLARDLVFTKFATAGVRIERVSVGGAPGLWLQGEHGIAVVEGQDGPMIAIHRTRLAANTLVWESDGVTYRLESKLSRDAAVKVAGTVR